MVKQVMDKYGAPTIVGDQHLYYIYRAGKIVSVGTKYKEAAALQAVDQPLEPRTAIKLNAANGRGSCVAAVKRLQTKDKTLTAMLEEAKGANCDGALSVQLATGAAPDRVGMAQFTLLDFKRICQRGRDRRRCACGRKERAQSGAQSQPAETVK